MGSALTSDGRLFQRRLAATGSARSPTVESLVHRTSLAARMTTTGDETGSRRDSDDWNRRHAGCGRGRSCSISIFWTPMITKYAGKVAGACQLFVRVVNWAAPRA